VVVAELLPAIRELAAAGVGIIVVEQSVNLALELADRAYFLERGEIRFDGPTRDLLDRPDLLRSVFLGNSHVSATTNGASHAHGEGDTLLQTSGLGVRFGGLQAVDDVTLEVRGGEIVGVVGPNGAGKTTLFDLVSGFERPTTGTVALLGNDITDESPSARARAGLGRSFQSARLFPELTVAENLAVAQHRWTVVNGVTAAALHLPTAFDSEEAVAARTAELVELFGLGDHQHQILRSLSTGTRRVVDLACLVAHRPVVVLLDEPTSGIAQREVEALAPLVRRLRDEMGASLLVIDHDLPFLTSSATASSPWTEGASSHPAHPTRCSPIPTSSSRTSAPQPANAPRRSWLDQIPHSSPNPQRSRTNPITGGDAMLPASPANEPSSNTNRALRRWGPLAAIVAVVAVVAAVVVLGGGDDDGDDTGAPETTALSPTTDPSDPGTDPDGTDPDGTDPDGTSPTTDGDGDDGTEIPTVLSFSEAQRLGIDVDWGERCDTSTGRVAVPDFFAPECYAPFTGDTGGSTARGVTADSIKIVLYQGPENDPIIRYITDALAIEETNEDEADTIRGMIAYFEAFYETYGRTVELVPFVSNGIATDEVAARADAVRIAEDIQPYMVWGGPALTSAFADELAALGVPCLSCTPGQPIEWYQERAPHVWAIDASGQQKQTHAAEFISKQLTGKPAEFAGDASFQSTPRRFGLLYLESSAASKALADGFTATLADGGVEVTETVAYALDPASIQQTASQAIARSRLPVSPPSCSPAIRWPRATSPEKPRPRTTSPSGSSWRRRSPTPTRSHAPTTRHSGPMRSV
jgi:ABC-type branched-subunit amino acid transport system ATPase component